MSASWTVVPPLLLAAVLAISAVAKLRDPRPAGDSFAALGFSPRIAHSPLPRALPWGELALAATLLTTSGRWYAVAASAAVALCTAYLVVIVRAARAPHPVSCRCFGVIGDGEVNSRTVWRNALLLGFAALTLADALNGPSVLARLAEADRSVWGWLAMITLAGVLVALIVGHSGRSGISGHLPRQAIDRPIPRLTIATADGSPWSLREQAAQQARVLLYVLPGCPSCSSVLPAAHTFVEQTPEVALHVVTTTPAAAPPGIPVLVDEHDLVAQVCELSAPGAVVLGTDGLIAKGPVSGASAVTALLTEATAEVAASR